MSFTLGLIVRIALFLGGVVPLTWWVIRKAREAQNIPSDRKLNRDAEAARAGVTAEPQHFYGRPIHERARDPQG